MGRNAEKMSKVFRLHSSYCQAATIYVHAYVEYVCLHKSFYYENITILLLLRNYLLIVAPRKIA